MTGVGSLHTATVGGAAAAASQLQQWQPSYNSSASSGLHKSYMVVSSLLLQSGSSSIKISSFSQGAGSVRNFSSPSAADTATAVSLAGQSVVTTKDGISIDFENSRVTTPTGQEYVIFEPPKFCGKLKPHIVKRRLARMRTYVGGQQKIRHSEWRANLVCQMVAGLTLDDALLQLAFSPKKMAPYIDKTLREIARRADRLDGLQTSQLEVAECFATKGTPIKKIKYHGKGGFGKMEHRFAHFRVVLREIDFKLRIYQARSLNQKKKWFRRQQHAAEEYHKSQVLRDELDDLRRQEAEFRKKEAEKDK